MLFRSEAHAVADDEHAGALRTAELVRRDRHELRRLGHPVDGFCYPYGDLSEATMTAVAGHGYGYAVATRPTGQRDRYALPRIYVGQADTGPRLLAKLVRHRLVWLARR